MPSINDSKCVLVTGGTAGIGRALALRIKDLPSRPKVIVAGRRKDRLDELAAKGFETVQVDLDTDNIGIKKFVDNLLAKYPELDAVILNAGKQLETWWKPDPEKPLDLDKLASEMNVNYTSIVATITYLMSHFLELAGQGKPCIIAPVTSGLAIVPAPWIANYSASKAALHSLCFALQAQFQGSNIHILEIIPPLVESELHDAEGTTERLSKMWMPLDEFTEIVITGLVNGDSHITAGMATQAFDRFEKGKVELTHKSMEMRNKW